MAHYEKVPGYLPENERPKCMKCRRTMPLTPMYLFEGRPLRAFSRSEVQFVAYGYRGNGRFCTQSCGYKYALAAVGGARAVPGGVAESTK